MKVQSLAPEITNPFADAAGGQATGQVAGVTGDAVGSTSTSWTRAVEEATTQGQTSNGFEAVQEMVTDDDERRDEMAELVDRIALQGTSQDGAGRRAMSILGNSRRGLWADLAPSPATMVAWQMCQSDVQTALDGARQFGVDSVARAMSPSGLDPADRGLQSMGATPTPELNPTPVLADLHASPDSLHGTAPVPGQPVFAGMADGLPVESLAQETTKTSYVRAQVEASVVKQPQVMGAHLTDAQVDSWSASMPGASAVTSPMMDADQISQVSGERTQASAGWQQTTPDAPLRSFAETASSSDVEPQPANLAATATKTSAPVMSASEQSIREVAATHAQITAPQVSDVPLVSAEAASLAWSDKARAAGMPTPSLDGNPPSLDGNPVNRSIESMLQRDLPTTGSTQATAGEVTRTPQPVQRDLSHPNAQADTYQEARGQQTNASRQPMPTMTREPAPAIQAHAARMEGPGTQASSAPESPSITQGGAPASSDGFGPTIEDAFARPAMSRQAPATYQSVQESGRAEVTVNTQVDPIPQSGAQPVMASGRVTELESQAGIQDSLLDAGQITAEEMPELPLQDMSQLDIDIDDPAGKVRLDLTRDAQEVAVRLQTPEEVLEEYRAMQEDIDEAIAQSGMSMSEFDAQSGDGNERSDTQGTEESHGVEPESRAEPLKSQGSSGRLLNRIV